LTVRVELIVGHGAQLRAADESPFAIG
jgi:hypothetical protein